MTERPLTVKGARQLISLTASLPAKVIVPLYAIDRGARSISIAKLMQLGLLRALIETNPDAPDDMTVVELAWPAGAPVVDLDGAACGAEIVLTSPSVDRELKALRAKVARAEKLAEGWQEFRLYTNPHWTTIVDCGRRLGMALRDGEADE